MARGCSKRGSRGVPFRREREPRPSNGTPPRAVAPFPPAEVSDCCCPSVRTSERWGAGAGGGRVRPPPATNPAARSAPPLRAPTPRSPACRAPARQVPESSQPRGGQRPQAFDSARGRPPAAAAGSRAATRRKLTPSPKGGEPSRPRSRRRARGGGGTWPSPETPFARAPARPPASPAPPGPPPSLLPAVLVLAIPREARLAGDCEAGRLGGWEAGRAGHCGAEAGMARRRAFLGGGGGGGHPPRRWYLLEPTFCRGGSGRGGVAGVPQGHRDRCDNSNVPRGGRLLTAYGCSPLLPAAARCFPLLPAAARCCPLLPAAARCCPLLLIPHSLLATPQRGGGGNSADLRESVGRPTVPEQHRADTPSLGAPEQSLFWGTVKSTD